MIMTFEKEENEWKLKLLESICDRAFGFNW